MHYEVVSKIFNEDLFFFLFQMVRRKKSEAMAETEVKNVPSESPVEESDQNSQEGKVPDKSEVGKSVNEDSQDKDIQDKKNTNGDTEETKPRRSSRSQSVEEGGDSSKQQPAEDGEDKAKDNEATPSVAEKVSRRSRSQSAEKDDKIGVPQKPKRRSSRSSSKEKVNDSNEREDSILGGEKLKSIEEEEVVESSLKIHVDDLFFDQGDEDEDAEDTSECQKPNENDLEKSSSKRKSEADHGKGSRKPDKKDDSEDHKSKDDSGKKKKRDKEDRSRRDEGKKRRSSSHRDADEKDSKAHGDVTDEKESSKHSRADRDNDHEKHSSRKAKDHSHSRSWYVFNALILVFISLR